MDADGDQELSWEEFEKAFEDVELRRKLRAYGVNRANCREIFHLLDSGDGRISTHEFFDGISHLEGQAQAADLFRTTKASELLVKLLLQQHKEMQEDIRELIRHTPGAQVRKR